MEIYEHQNSVDHSIMKIEPDTNSYSSRHNNRLRDMIKKLLVRISNFLPKTQRQVYFSIGQTTSDQSE